MAADGCEHDPRGAEDDLSENFEKKVLCYYSTAHLQR